MFQTEIFRFIQTLFIGVLIMIQTACTPKPITDLTQESIIPKPVSMTATGGTFPLTQKAEIFYSTESNELKRVSQYLANILSPATGFDFKVSVNTSEISSGNIYLSLNANDSELGKEGYLIDVTKKIVMLSANNTEGLFRGIQTLRQLLPASIEMQTIQEQEWIIPTGTIRDFPNYAFRGAMLDVSRHFFGVEDVKRYIDLISAYKLNILHLHLTDDQGWRIEIKSWPNLTMHGGKTQVGGGKGGFFTQKEYSEIVQYALDRYITIIPEIDMPGHTNAALASYGELNCDGIPRKLYRGMKVGFSTFCTDSSVVYSFIDDVIRELVALTPGPYIHIGGDESLKTEKKDYIPFINRASDIVESYGKIVIGWDEVAHADIEKKTIIQYWAKDKNVQLGVQKGAKVIMSPSKHIYLDIKYDDETPIGLTWAGLSDVDNAYNWTPTSLIPGIERDNILGIEAPLWTETVKTMADIEYMTFPRIPGVAEIGWTADKARSWSEYKNRLAKHGKRFEAMDINFYKSPKIDWEK